MKQKPTKTSIHWNERCIQELNKTQLTDILQEIVHDSNKISKLKVVKCQPAS